MSGRSLAGFHSELGASHELFRGNLGRFIAYDESRGSSVCLGCPRLDLDELGDALKAAEDATDVLASVLDERADEPLADVLLALSLAAIVQHHDVVIVGADLAEQQLGLLRVLQRVQGDVLRGRDVPSAERRGAARVQQQVPQAVDVPLDPAEEERVDLHGAGGDAGRGLVPLERLQRYGHFVVQQVVEAMHEPRRRLLHQPAALDDDVGDHARVAVAVAQLGVERAADLVERGVEGRRIGVLVEEEGRLVVLEGQVRDELQQLAGRVGEDALLVGDEVGEHGEHVDGRVFVENVLVPDRQQQRLGHVVREEGQQPRRREDGRDHVVALQV